MSLAAAAFNNGSTNLYNGDELNTASCGTSGTSVGAQHRDAAPNCSKRR
jgi:hypothetical protein